MWLTDAPRLTDVRNYLKSLANAAPERVLPTGVTAEKIQTMGLQELLNVARDLVMNPVFWMDLPDEFDFAGATVSRPRAREELREAVQACREQDPEP